MNKEKVRELVLYLRKTESSKFEDSIEFTQEWLEQNQPEPIVVGLSDEQVKELTTHFICEKPDVDSPKECHEVISNYLKTQTFAQPENLIVSNSTQLKPNWDDAPDWADWLAQDSDETWWWFESKPKMGYGTWVSNDNYGLARKFIESWQQSLEQRPLVTTSKQDESFFVDEKDVERSPPNSDIGIPISALNPNWDDAPDNAAYFRVLTNWCDEYHQVLRSHLISEEQRPSPPSPKVEVGQVWKYEGVKYRVDLVGLIGLDVMGETEWIKSVTYINDEDAGIYTRTLEDFLSKFERVE